MLTEMSSMMKEMKNVLANDPISELIDHLKKENRKELERENMFMSLMINLFSPQQTAVANAIVHYPPQNGMTRHSDRMHTLNKPIQVA